MHRSGAFATVSFWSLVVLVATLPIVFVSSAWGGILATKALVLYGIVFFATLCYLASQFFSGSIVIPRHRILALVAVWVGLVFVSALLSANTSVSLWGRGFAQDSFVTVCTLGLIVLLVGLFARVQKRLVTLFVAIFIASTAAVLLQVLLYAIHSPILAHVSREGSIVGTWVDFSYFVTLTLIVGLLSYEVLAPKGFFKWFALGSMILSTGVLVFLNFKTAWMVTIVSALIVFVYKASVERAIDTKHRQRFPALSFATLLVGVFFFLTAGSIGARVAQSIKLSFNDIRPSAATTMTVTMGSLKQDSLFGAGPGRFAQVWDKYHPVQINQTAFWNTSFESGFSTLQTMLATHGILPTLLFVAIIVLSLIHGFKLFGSTFPDRFSRFIAVVSLVMVLAMALLVTIAAPGIVLVTIGFVYIGMLVGVSQLVGKTAQVSWDYLRDPRRSFVTIFTLVVAVIGCVVIIFSAGKRFAGIVYFNRALRATDIDTSERMLARAISQNETDLYWRAGAALAVQQFLSATNTQSPDKAVLQSAFASAEARAQRAVAWDKTDARNWALLAQVYQLAGTSGNEQALKGWEQAAAEAQKRNPVHPLYRMLQAQQAAATKEYDRALELYTSARTLAPSNPDA